jgi:hypothetical protein
MVRLGEVTGNAAYTEWGTRVVATHVNPDGSGQRTMTSYGEAKAQTASREDFDVEGRVTRRVVDHLDAGGRLSDRREVSVDKDGKETGHMSTYTYAPDGQPQVHSAPITASTAR